MPPDQKGRMAMSFPYHDAFWCGAADFLQARANRQSSILAPDIFWWRFRKISHYINARLNPDFQYDWIVLHKGLIDELSALFIPQAFSTHIPLFANEVFVILGRGRSEEAVATTDPHLASLTERLPYLVHESGQRSSPAAAQPVLPEPGAIFFKFSALQATEFADAMDQFWLNGGYVYPTLRDRTYYAEIDRYVTEFIGNGQGRRSSIYNSSRSTAARHRAQSARCQGSRRGRRYRLLLRGHA
jgi:hypothetical protein